MFWLTYKDEGKELLVLIGDNCRAAFVIMCHTLVHVCIASVRRDSLLIFLSFLPCY